MTPPRWMRSARRRPAAFAAILLLSAGAVLVSGVTPILIGALDRVTLRDAAASAPMPLNGFAVSALAPTADDLADAQNAVDSTLQRVTGTSDRWGPSRSVVEPAFTAQLLGAGTGVRARFSITEDGCAGLRIEGRCPTSVTEALVPASLSGSTGWRAGTAIGTPLPNGRTLRMTVVGVYDDSRGPGRVLADPTVLQATTVPRAVPNPVIGPARASSLGTAFQLTGGVRLERPLRPADLPGIRRAIALAADSVTASDQGAIIAAARTRLPVLLRSIERQQAASAVLAAPVGLAAVLLAWLALGAVAQRNARSRAAEWGVGRMRGARPRRWTGAVFLEPLVAIVAGAAVGCGAAVLASFALAALLFDAVADVDVATAPVVAAVALAVVGSVVALVASTVRGASLPLPDLLQDTAEPRQLSRPALVGQVVVVSLAAAVIWAALTTVTLGGQQLGLLMPAMLALLVAIGAVRLVVVLVRRSSARPPRSLLALVVGRGLARAPSTLVAAQLILVSVAVAACGLQLELASTTLQTDRATLATGAAQVLTVRVPQGVSLLQAVRRADPAGRTAMAAADLTAGPVGGSRITAVDTTRVDAVSAWRSAWRGGVDLARLRPRSAPDLVLRGTRLSVRIQQAVETADEELGVSPISLTAVLVTKEGWSSVEVGTVRVGELSTAIPCRDGCRLAALSLRQRGPAQDQFPWQEDLRISALSTDEQPASTFAAALQAARWRNRVIDQIDETLPARAEVADAEGGLAVSAIDTDGGHAVQIEPTSVPDAVPVVAGSDAPLLRFPPVRGTVTGSSLSDTPLLLRPVGRAPAVPRSLRGGVLADLGEMERLADPTGIVAEQQVWMTAGNHPSVVAALRRQGITVLETRRATDAVAAGLRAPTNRALQVAGVAALIGLLFGLLALSATRVIDAPARRRDWATLRLAGVTPRTLRRLALVQVAAPAVAAALLGVVAGSVAANAIVGRLPLLVGQSAGPPFGALPPVAALALLAVVVVVLVVAVSAATTAVETSRTRA